MTDNKAPELEPRREKVLELVRFCLSYTDRMARSGLAEAHDGLTDRWDALGMDVNDRGWVDDILSALDLAPVTPAQAVDVLLLLVTDDVADELRAIAEGGA